MADVAARPLHEPILHRAVPPPSTGAFPLSRPSGILVVMAVTLRVEEYGFMVFPEVFDGPRWARPPHLVGLIRPDGVPHSADAEDQRNEGEVPEG